MNKKRPLTFLAWILLTVLVSSPAGASTVQEETIDLQMRDIAKTLRCTICQNESIWESQAELARQMRDLIKERLMKGETPDQVRAYFLSRYGDYILLAPQKRGLNWLLWGGPFFVLIVGGLFLYRTLTRWVAQAAAAKQEAPPPIDERMRKRIDVELHSRED